MPDKFQFVSEQENVRLDVFLAEKLALTRTKVKDMIEQGHAMVNGKTAKPSLVIRKAMEISGEIPEEEPLTLVAQDIPLEILYEDDYFLAINKEADMVVHPSAGHTSGTLVNAVLAYLGKDAGRRTQDTGHTTQAAGPHEQREDGRGKREEAAKAENVSWVSGTISGFRISDLRHLEHGTLNVEPEHPDTQYPTPDTGSMDQQVRQQMEEDGRGKRKALDSNLEHGTLNVELSKAAAALRPGIVHRLDKGTTGVILIAKDSKTQEMLSGMFKDRRIRKTYRALVEGAPKRNEWKSEGNIGRHPIERKKMAVLKTGGRTAETDFKVLQKLHGFTYVEAYPKTGRTHQIRVHLAHAGNPIVGDETYGGKAKKLADRPLLHAYRIEFDHPVTGAPITIIAPVPADMIEFAGSNQTA